MDDGRRTTDDGRRTTDDRRRTTDDGWRTHDGRRTIDDRRHTTDDGRRTRDDGDRKRDDRGRTTDESRATDTTTEYTPASFAPSCACRRLSTAILQNNENPTLAKIWTAPGSCSLATLARNAHKMAQVQKHVLQQMQQCNVATVLRLDHCATVSPVAKPHQRSTAKCAMMQPNHLHSPSRELRPLQFQPRGTSESQAGSMFCDSDGTLVKQSYLTAMPIFVFFPDFCQPCHCVAAKSRSSSRGEDKQVRARQRPRQSSQQRRKMRWGP